MEDQVVPEVKSKSGGKTVLILILILLLGGSGVYNFFLWDKEKESTALANSKLDSLKSYHSLKDSLYSALVEEEQKVAGLRAEIVLYQGDNDSLKQLIEAKEAKIASLRAMVSSGGSPAKLRALKDSITRLKADNKEFLYKVDALLAENDDYKAMLLEKEAQITALEEQKKILNDKVTIAAQPTVGAVMVIPQYEKKGVFIPIYKAKKVQRLQITFDVLGNKLTDKKVEKEYIVRVIDPDGIVLSKNNTKLTDSDDVYTIKETVTFNGTLEKVKNNYSQEQNFKKGKYKVELKDGSEVKQTTTFELM